MHDSLTIDVVVRQTGITSRALRFYEARGLVNPLRTYNGRRLYSPRDLEQIHHIITLKKAGLSLAQIKQLILKKPIDLAALIEGQLATLDDQARVLDHARARLSALLSRVKTGERLDAATLCSLIKETECMNEDKKWQAVIDRYYSPEEQAEWFANVKPVTDRIMTNEYNEQWFELAGRIEAALPLDPASDTALGFVREWYTLLEPFSRVATAEMWQGAFNFYEKLPEWEGEVKAPFSSRVWSFIREATHIARSVGKDIGPVPIWLNNDTHTAKGVN
jgi:MerR family transcriptional regulator, thiopeptide resistance regulator